LPETSAPSPGAFGAVFRKAAESGAEGVLCVNISSRMSATIQAAQAAAKDVADTIPVRVVDSLNVSFGQGLQVLTGARLAEEGHSLDDVADAVERIVPRTRLFGVLGTLENLKKGGRIGGAQALLGSMLSIKPVVQVADGVVEEESKQRTRSRSLRYLADKIAQAAKNGEIEQLAVMQGDASDFDEFLGLLDPIVPKDNMLVGWVGPVIGTHAGPGVIGCAWVDPT
jgi:DegV family protein with EDD domain